MSGSTTEISLPGFPLVWASEFGKAQAAIMDGEPDPTLYARGVRNRMEADRARYLLDSLVS
ncbi:MAG: hypothetical protein MUF72_17200 [Elainella sp. Prado103]|nr:hypothetical protein [Elainella sp. Prado103]